MAVTPQKPKKKKMPFAAKFSIFLILTIMLVFFPSTVLFCGCMIPTFVAGLIDNQPQKTAWITVGAMNFAGTVPAWFTLWDTGHTLANALLLIMQPKILVIAYGGAGIGWFLYYNITPLVAAGIAMRSEKRLKDIDKRQKELVRRWGQAVAE